MRTRYKYKKNTVIPTSILSNVTACLDTITAKNFHDQDKKE